VTDRGEHLRRRLYEPGARGEDVAAYLAVREPEPEAPEEVSPRPDAARGAPRWPIGAVGIAIVAVVVLLGVVRTPTSAAPAGPVPTPLPAIAVDPATSARFVGRITADRDAGLAAWVDPQAAFVEAHGVGTGTVELPPPSGTGRITVVLVVASDATAGWSLGRLVIHDDRTIHLSQVAGATGTLRAGDPAVAEVPFTPLTRPARLQVRVPAGVRWGVAAVYRG
jgi:hypothetical protein